MRPAVEAAGIDAGELFPGFPFALRHPDHVYHCWWWLRDGYAMFRDALVGLARKRMEEREPFVIAAPDGELFECDLTKFFAFEFAARAPEPLVVKAVLAPVVNSVVSSVMVAALENLQPLRKEGWLPLTVVGDAILSTVPEGSFGTLAGPILDAAQQALDDLGVYLPPATVQVSVSRAWGRPDKIITRWTALAEGRTMLHSNIENAPPWA